MLSSLAPARRRLVVSVLTLVLAAVVAGIVAVAVSRSSGGAGSGRPVPQSDPGPVVLVPGYGGGTGGLESLATVLRAHGRSASVFHLPGDGQGDLDAQAVSLAAFASSVRTSARAATVDVVGYSAGGVVARLFVRDHGGAAYVRRVVTLGSPHHGTDVAGLAGSLLPSACPTACQQLEPDSPLLHALNSGDETPAGPSWVSVWTTKDEVVVPPDSARLNGALDFTVQSVCASSEVAHGDLPADSQVQAIVVSVLEGVAARAPTTCGSFS